MLIKRQTRNSGCSSKTWLRVFRVEGEYCESYTNRRFSGDVVQVELRSTGQPRVAVPTWSVLGFVVVR